MTRGRAVAFDPGSRYWHVLAEMEMADADTFAPDWPTLDVQAHRWRMAARYEFKALATIPPERPRTRKVIEESYLSCLRRAQALECRWRRATEGGG